MYTHVHCTVYSMYDTMISISNLNLNTVFCIASCNGIHLHDGSFWETKCLAQPWGFESWDEILNVLKVGNWLKCIRRSHLKTVNVTFWHTQKARQWRANWTNSQVFWAKKDFYFIMTFLLEEKGQIAIISLWKPIFNKMVISIIQKII